MMKRTLTTLFLALAIALAPFGPAVRGQQSAYASETAKLKAEVERRLSKKEERVKVKLRNGSQVKGRITQSNYNGFTLTDEKTGSHSDFAYTDVLEVEGRGMSKKKKILIATGIGVGLVIVVVALALTQDFELNGPIF
jgi:sRNA-binding regulator protein Hfq